MTQDRRWGLLRLALAVVHVGLLAYVGVSSRTEAPLLALYTDVRDGRVDDVEVVGGLPPDAEGTATQTLTWSTGYRRWVAELVVERPFGTAGELAEGRERTQDDVAAMLRQIDPRLEVRSQETYDRTDGRPFFEVLGTPLPTLLAVPALLGVVGGFLLFFSGPEPLRANRWAWFWLLGVPGSALAYLVLAGPTPGIRTPPPDAPRLRGGSGFVLALVLSLVVGALVALARQVLWPPHA